MTEKKNEEAVKKESEKESLQVGSEEQRKTPFGPIDSRTGTLPKP